MDRHPARATARGGGRRAAGRGDAASGAAGAGPRAVRPAGPRGGRGQMARKPGDDRASADLRHLDLYLVRVLRTLIVERSVSRTARKLNQSQPQISAALARLRRLTGDQLLIRSQRGMTPTEYGQSLVGPAS